MWTGSSAVLLLAIAYRLGVCVCVCISTIEFRSTANRHDELPLVGGHKRRIAFGEAVHSGLQGNRQDHRLIAGESFVLSGRWTTGRARVEGERKISLGGPCQRCTCASQNHTHTQHRNRSHCRLEAVADVSQVGAEPRQRVVRHGHREAEECLLSVPIAPLAPATTASSRRVALAPLGGLGDGICHSHTPRGRLDHCSAKRKNPALISSHVTL